MECPSDSVQVVTFAIFLIQVVKDMNKACCVCFSLFEVKLTTMIGHKKKFITKKRSCRRVGVPFYNNLNINDLNASLIG
jgi:hypothetical protein